MADEIKRFRVWPKSISVTKLHTEMRYWGIDSALPEKASPSITFRGTDAEAEMLRQKFLVQSVEEITDLKLDNSSYYRGLSLR